MNYVFWQLNLYTGTSLAQMFCFNKEIVNISFLDHNDNKKYLNVFSRIPFYNCLLAHNSHTGILSKQIPLLLGQVNYLEFIKIHNLLQM